MTTVEFQGISHDGSLCFRFERGGAFKVKSINNKEGFIVINSIYDCTIESFAKNLIGCFEKGSNFRLRTIGLEFNEKCIFVTNNSNIDEIIQFLNKNVKRTNIDYKNIKATDMKKTVEFIASNCDNNLCFKFTKYCERFYICELNDGIMTIDSLGGFTSEILILNIIRCFSKDSNFNGLKAIRFDIRTFIKKEVIRQLRIEEENAYFSITPKFMSISINAIINLYNKKVGIELLNCNDFFYALKYEIVKILFNQKYSDYFTFLKDCKRNNVDEMTMDMFENMEYRRRY